MKGVSTKLTAATIAAYVVTILVWVLTEASFGPGWEPAPTAVVQAVTALIAFVVGYFVPEQAGIEG